MRKIKTLSCQGCAVIYQVSVLDKQGKTVRTFPAKRNLILDQGLNQLATTSYENVFTNAVAGTGTNPIKRDSGATVFSQSGTTITAGTNFFEAADVGRLFKFDSGEEAYITVFTSALVVTVNISRTVASSQGTVWYVNRTGLQTEVKRTSTLGTDGGDNSGTWSTPSWTIKRTFIFSAESGSVTYNEIGWASTSTPGGNLFGMDIISPGVGLIATQQLKVTVSLVITFTPVVPTAWTNPITGGFGANGNSMITCLGNTSSSTPVGPDSAALLPNTTGGFTFVLSDSSAALPAGTITNAFDDVSGAGGGLVSAVQSGGTYVAGTFLRDYTFTWGPTLANRATNRQFGKGGASGGNWRAYFRILMGSNQTKVSTNSLAITLRIAWGRILVN